MSGGDMRAIVGRWKTSLGFPGRPNEWESKELLKAIGIAVPKAAVLPGQRDAAAATVQPAAVQGDLPVLGSPSPRVAKVCSAEILHKTDRGGVILDLSESQLPTAVDTLRTRFPGADILIEEMIRYRGGEYIIGALHDPTFGPAVMAGAGGVLTELYKDVAFRLAPCSSEEAHRLLEELIVYPTLCGYRGRSGDVGGLARIIEKVAQLALELAQPEFQLDINPIVWAGGRWVALDTKIILG